MNRIIIGTTPTIIYTFKTVNVSDLVVAILTIKSGKATLTKTLEDADVGEGRLSWTLTQEETLSICDDVAAMMLNWKTAGGTRGASAKTTVVMSDNYVREVI